MKVTLSMLVHAFSGVGKSWFADSAPYPRLVIDLEGRARYTPSGPKIAWDPRSGPPPLADGTWSTCVVMAPDFDTLNLVYQWLRAGQHHFKSVIIDSVMEAQKRCIDNVAGTAGLDQQDWGTLLRHLEGLIRNYRDLTLIPSNPVEVIVFIVGSRTNDKSGKIEPLLQGQLRDTIPYYIDVVGYMFKQPQADGSLVRSLLINEQPGFIAKDGTGRLVAAYPSGIVPLPDHTPNLERLHDLLRNGGQPHTIEAPAVVQEVATA